MLVSIAIFTVISLYLWAPELRGWQGSEVAMLGTAVATALLCKVWSGCPREWFLQIARSRGASGCVLGQCFWDMNVQMKCLGSC